MNITIPHYPGFQNCNYLEELTLQLGREVAEIQKNSNYNTQNEEIISIISSETNETCDIVCNNWIGQWVNGVFVVKNYFPTYNFPNGEGSYPFNRTNLCDAFFHVAIYQQKMEISTSKNPQKLGFISWDIKGEEEIGASNQCLISLEIMNLPITVSNQSDQTITKAKAYLS